MESSKMREVRITVSSITINTIPAIVKRESFFI